MVVFGFDSGIARGGIGIFYPEYEIWSFILLKWVEKSVKTCQMCDLIQLDNGTWLSALGTPQAIAASKNLKQFPYTLRVLKEGSIITWALRSTNLQLFAALVKTYCL